MSSSRNQTLLDVAHPDFLLAQQLAYDPNGLEATNIRIEKESADYGALDFQLNGKTCKFRVGKITPKKVGFFFTIW
ncbi:MAG: MepB family protein, partial [Chlamydiia bacterium]|nr:MepB family protein [Chlamydiia bacterium]